VRIIRLPRVALRPAIAGVRSTRGYNPAPRWGESGRRLATRRISSRVTPEAHRILERAVRADGFTGTFAGELRDECPVMPAGRIREQGLKRDADRPFVQRDTDSRIHRGLCSNVRSAL
jgi:hypothetical protein